MDPRTERAFAAGRARRRRGKRQVLADDGQSDLSHVAPYVPPAGGI
jgi:hypothetical protein